MCVRGSRGIWELFILPIQFCCEPEIALKQIKFRIKLFSKNPCNCTVEFSPNLQLEVIGLHCNITLEGKYHEKQLIEFLNSGFQMMNIFNGNYTITF